MLYKKLSLLIISVTPIVVSYANSGCRCSQVAKLEPKSCTRLRVEANMGMLGSHDQ